MSMLTKISMSPLASLAVFASPSVGHAVEDDCRMTISASYLGVREILVKHRGSIQTLTNEVGREKQIQYMFDVPCRDGLEFLKSNIDSGIVCETRDVGIWQEPDGEVAYYHRVCTGNGGAQADIPYTFRRPRNRAAALGRGVSIEDSFQFNKF